ncbi:glycosyl transferase [Opitutaceae bacterium EW11]|nr:glycosyl transferase [Opitutaceae bacterium EW11]
MESSPHPRLAIVLSHPIQYYSPWFRWMRAHTDLSFRVFYLSDFGIRPALDAKFGCEFAWDVDLTSGYDFEFVANVAKRPDTLRFDGLKNPELFARLRAWSPDAILLFGYKYNTHVRLIAWARLHGIPLIFRGDSHLIGREKRSVFASWGLRALYRQFAAVTYVGYANRDYFQAFGVPAGKLFFAPHAVDRALFDPKRAEHRIRASALRKELGLPGSARVILFSGKLISSKQPRSLLDAFIAAEIPDSVLLIAGDGPEKSDLVARASGLVGSRIHFLPFANQSEMPARYLLAELFVLPSRGFYETWGLSVNEAMLMGVPCLVSDHVGCQRDLVTDGQTGWVVPAGDDVALATKLRDALAELKGHGERIRGAATERAARYSYEQATAGLRAAVVEAVP